jgi:hypothetical protein
MIKAIGQLQGQCIYCTIMIEGEAGKSHKYSNCIDAEADRCGFALYKQWRSGVSFGQAKHC